MQQSPTTALSNLTIAGWSPIYQTFSSNLQHTKSALIPFSFTTLRYEFKSIQIQQAHIAMIVRDNY